MSARLCVTCSRSFQPVGKARYCSDDCRHGTSAGYAAGCTCGPCARAHARQHQLLRLYPNPLVPAIGTHRRIRALARLGWSPAELSRRLGRSRSFLQKVLANTMVEPSTASLVTALYDDLSLTRCTTPTANRTAMMAAQRGWPFPLAWDNPDDPDEQPTDWAYVAADRAETLAEVLEQRGNTFQACRVLGISRDSLHKWCERNGHVDVFRALAAREVTRPNQHTDLEQAAS